MPGARQKEKYRASYTNAQPHLASITQEKDDRFMLVCCNQLTVCCIPCRHIKEMIDEQAQTKSNYNTFLYKNITHPIYFSKGVVAGIRVRERLGDRGRQRRTAILINNFNTMLCFQGLTSLPLLLQGHTKLLPRRVSGSQSP